MGSYKVPTWTSLVLDELIRADDFRTLRELVVCVGGTSNQISAALWLLTQRKAVGCEICNGVSYYYATPEYDTRIRKMGERTPEMRPRKLRRKRVVHYEAP